jgi:hypothetical protein
VLGRIGYEVRAWAYSVSIRGDEVNEESGWIGLGFGFEGANDLSQETGS